MTGQPRRPPQVAWLGLGSLATLRALNLSHNQFTALPPTIGLCGALERLDFSHNRISALAVTELVMELTRLQRLSLASNDLTDDGLPPELANCVALRELDLSGNAGISKLPAACSRLHKLRTLSLADCGIRDAQLLSDALPSGDTGCLEALYLQGNLLERLPASLSGQTRLVHLDCSRNELTSLGTPLPASLGHLDLGANRLRDLPNEEMAALPALTFLSLASNSLGAFPPAVGSMFKLRSLDVSRNHIPEVTRCAPRVTRASALAPLLPVNPLP